jgi:signal recognition particle receptor subunit beta
MSMINYASREINCKIVYYGTGLGGKTTNLEYIYSRVNPETKGKMISLATETERTLFFYTVPGQVYYNASRRLILKGVDGIVFIADSQASRAEANVESMHNLHENLETYGYDLRSLPFAIQYNKRDLGDIVPVEDLRAQINPMGVPDFEGIAIEGEGVFETLSCVSKLVVKALS